MSICTARRPSFLKLSYYCPLLFCPGLIVLYSRSLKAEEDFVDVTLSCEENQYSAHKVVLSACSPYFRKLLKVGQNYCMLFWPKIS